MFISKSRKMLHALNMTKIVYFFCGILQGRVARKVVNFNPGLNVNCSIIFSCLKMFLASNVWCSLRLLQLKTEGQTT